MDIVMRVNVPTLLNLPLEATATSSSREDGQALTDDMNSVSEEMRSTFKISTRVCIAA